MVYEVVGPGRPALTEERRVKVPPLGRSASVISRKSGPQTANPITKALSRVVADVGHTSPDFYGYCSKSPLDLGIRRDWASRDQTDDVDGTTPGPRLGSTYEQDAECVGRTWDIESRSRM